jgi:hypothetical protein
MEGREKEMTITEETRMAVEVSKSFFSFDYS